LIYLKSAADLNGFADEIDYHVGLLQQVLRV